jgi:homopolymeric O-antigen transport system permease protein
MIMKNKTHSKTIKNSASDFTFTIRQRKGWKPFDLAEFWQYRDLFRFLVWRDIKVRYAQSVLGVGWAVIQPVFTMIVFTIVFGKLAKVGSDGVPYAIFSFTALVPWTFFSNSLTEASGSLIGASGLLTKIYFPRIIIPITPVLGKLVDFFIALLLLFLMMVWFRTIPTIWILFLPFLILIIVLSATGLGMWLTALAIQYRDIKYGMSFAIQLLMYASPVVYPASLIPDKYRLIIALNPMFGVIEGFRSALLDTNPMPWDLIIVGGLAALTISISGVLYFNRVERIFADVA